MNALSRQSPAARLETSTDAPPLKVQYQVLSARYRACMLGDWPTLLLLLAQAPFIGWLCTLVWGSVETDTPSLYFVLCLSAVWFGCINACREIVKERAILERERLFGLSMLAYVASRFRFLAGLALAQVLLMQIAVEWTLALRGPFLLQTLALWFASLCGIGLGLLVSALSSRQERAVGAVPLLILPQILFSELAVPRETFTAAVRWGEKIMPVHWSYEVFQELAAVETAWGSALFSLAVMPFIAVLLGLLSVLALTRPREAS